jgi:D-alanyl-D-alanine carboxypeptidase
MQKKVFIVLVVVVLAVAGYLAFHKNSNSTSTNKSTSSSSTSPGTNPNSFNKQQYSLTDPTSIWVVVNKQHPLNPKDYAPADLVTPNVPLRVPGNASMQLRQASATALGQMFTAAKTQGVSLMLSSGYRSYAYQVSLYGGYVQSMGQAAADQQSARPGYSEHQTGFAADIEPVSRACELGQCFADTPEGNWLAANAYSYGFIMRYNASNQALTGYEPEPWHIRYVGVGLATEMHNTGIDSLEQFFGVSGGAGYN